MNEINLAPDLIDRTAASLVKVFSIFNTQHLLFITLAALPVALWLYVFWRYQRENKLLAIISFFGGMLAVVPIYVFQHEIGRIESWLSVVAWCAIAEIILLSLWVGLYEEVTKNWIVRIINRKYFRNIDDAIQFSIIVALGFAFLENILYLYDNICQPNVNLMSNLGFFGEVKLLLTKPAEYCLAGSTGSQFWFYFAFRAIGSTFLHVFASGIFGYYYGLSQFATPLLQDRLAKNGKIFFSTWVHRIIHLKTQTVFRDEKIVEGVLLATLLHGSFNFMMGMSQHSADIGSSFGTKLWLILTVPFLVAGYFWLTYLLDKKENHKMYSQLFGREELDVVDEERGKIKKTMGSSEL